MRDRFDGLKCSVPGCKKTIYALTGLQELEKLQKHMKRCHLVTWNCEQTLENRNIIENRGE